MHLKRTFNEMALRRAANRGDLDAVRAHVDAGISVDAVSEGGWTALTHAAAKGHLTVMRFLIERGASVDTGDMYGNTPLVQAAKQGQLEAVRLLLDKGAMAGRTRKAGCYGEQTPLTAAVASRNLDILKELIRHGADVEDASYYDGSPLMAAARKGWVEGVDELVKAGADIHTAHGLLGGTRWPWECKYDKQQAIQKIFDAELADERIDRARRHGVKLAAVQPAEPPKKPPGFSL